MKLTWVRWVCRSSFRQMNPIMVVTIFLMILLSCSAVVSADEIPANSKNPQIILSYWNDNWPFQNQLADIITPGDDDHMTASWRLELATGDPAYLRAGELYYAIFTNRQENYRFDMLAWRYAHEFQREKWRYKLGGGFLIRGAMGWYWIQNNYHAARGYSPVDLPYLEKWRFGGLFYGRAVRDILDLGKIHLQGYATTALRLGAGPTSIRSGLEAKHNWQLKHTPLRGQFLGRLGYAHYLRPREVIEPHFRYGTVTGVYAGAVWKDRWGLALWFTENQYGLNDPHYGLTLIYRHNGLMLRGLHGVMFP